MNHLNVDDNSQVSILAEKIIQQISQEFELHNKAVRINTSIGIIVPEDDKINADDLLSRSDAALFKAKDAGRGTYAFFRGAMTIQLQRFYYTQPMPTSEVEVLLSKHLN